MSLKKEELPIDAMWIPAEGTQKKKKKAPTASSDSSSSSDDSGSDRYLSPFLSLLFLTGVNVRIVVFSAIPATVRFQKLVLRQSHPVILPLAASCL